jgi:hypothetical protein
LPEEAGAPSLKISTFALGLLVPIPTFCDVSIVIAVVPLVAILTAPPEESIVTLDVPLDIDVDVTLLVPPIMVGLVNVKLPILVIVFPRATEALPIVTGVTKLESKLDNGIDVVAVPKV